MNIFALCYTILALTASVLALRGKKGKSGNGAWRRTAPRNRLTRSSGERTHRGSNTRGGHVRLPDDRIVTQRAAQANVRPSARSVVFDERMLLRSFNNMSIAAPMLAAMRQDRDEDGPYLTSPTLQIAQVAQHMRESLPFAMIPRNLSANMQSIVRYAISVISSISAFSEEVKMTAEQVFALITLLCIILSPPPIRRTSA